MSHRFTVNPEPSQPRGPDASGDGGSAAGAPVGASAAPSASPAVNASDLKFREDLQLLIRSGHGLIIVETHEENRLQRLVLTSVIEDGRLCFAWSRIRGLVSASPNATDVVTVSDTNNVITTLRYLKTLNRRWTVVLQDLHRHLDDAEIARALREAAGDAAAGGNTIIVSGPSVVLPVELERLAVHQPLPLPDAARLEALVFECYHQVRRSAEDVRARLRRSELDRLVEAMLGLTEDEARRILAMAILRDGVLDAADVEEVREAKRKAVATRGPLEVLPAIENLDSIGGLGELKAWLKQRHHASSSRAREFGLPAPRGILMLGVQGCGKSLCAKVVAGEWKRPLLRLDVGALYNRFVGATESNLREALRQAEAMAPCVLWIDEIEKAFASTSGGGDGGDGGVSQRLFATMLGWMNDHRSDVFLAATGNDVSRLPPELLRRGRFDEIFFVDLPPADARRRIFEIHLQKRKRAPSNFDLNRLVAATEGFSGAEIEQAVVDGLYRAFEANRDLDDAALMAAIADARPVSVVMSERITALRHWASSRCRPAHGKA